MNFGPAFTSAKAANPAAVYTFYAGAPAVAFVKQYSEFGLKPTVPLYAAGFLTEGGALMAEGAAAEGIRTVAPYAPGLDNAANKAFAPALTAATKTQPNLYHVTIYDAAMLLDKAITAAGADPTPEAINKAIESVGQLDSPRGALTIAGATHTPVQPWYLREVQPVGGVLTNVKIADLGTVGG
jgi:branched-chain amino acid transport system substrate-binding protein